MTGNPMRNKPLELDLDENGEGKHSIPGRKKKKKSEWVKSSSLGLRIKTDLVATNIKDLKIKFPDFLI